LKQWIIVGTSLAVGVAVGVTAFVYSGMYEMGADVPHWSSTMRIVETLRDRSIIRHSRDVRVPDLDNAQLILKGAGQYSAMCVNCHLAPGISTSEIRPGLYPQPPELWKTKIDPKILFWVTKHGIKMSGMPAWGHGHDDAALWSIVAFVNKLPNLTPAQYKDIVAKAPPDEEMEGMSPGEKGPIPDNAVGKPKIPASPAMGNMSGMR
jgi:mono/diheme cytochrome c family protein